MNEKKMDLERILEEKSIYTVFQPIVSIRTGEVLGYEALSRIKDLKEIENIEELFETAILYDRIWKLEKLCRKKAFENFSLQKNYQNKKLFVNVNPIVIKDKKFRMGFTDEHLSEYHIKKENIIIEITEKGNPKDLEGFQKAIEHYKGQNYGIAMDDVGEGNSGLTMICNIRPKYLKLDMKLIRDIHKNPLKKAIVASMVELSKSTGIELIAEGIEKESELQTLMDLGVQYGQGYFLQRPNEQTLDLERELVEKIRILSGVNVKIIKEPYGEQDILREVLVVDYQLSIEAAARIAMNRLSGQLYDAIIVTKDDRFFGIVTMKELILTFIRMELKRAKAFQEKIKTLYNKKDWERGYIVAKGRDKIERNFGIVTISAAVISNQQQKDIDEKAISLQIAELKKKSKKIEGNSFLML